MGKWDPVESYFNGVIANRVFGKPMIGCHILQCTGSLKFDPTFLMYIKSTFDCYIIITKTLNRFIVHFPDAVLWFLLTPFQYTST